jgi:DNA mismatch repair protein MutL
MGDRIQVLPSALIDQIAAGEVVERPASVVKELVENALDAGAGRIEVRVRDGGRDLVRVSDDGAGMDRADLALSVVRHATSKIRAPADLQHIATLGFRGEALPSIAAVSRMTIVSRRADYTAGHRLEAAGGEPPRINETGAARGTDVRVADLFFNTPARRKFLRTAATEMGHISAWLTHLGLARPRVHLRLEHNGRKVIDAPGNAELAQRVAALLGREAYEHLHPIADEQPGIRVSGLVSDPGHSRRNTRGIHLFVNGRFVRDRLLQYAIMDAYRTVLPERRYPLVVLRLDLDPELVDVNVHPQKTEVRFADGRRVQRALAAAIGQTLAASPWAEALSPALAEQPGRRYRLDGGPRPAASPQAAAAAERVRAALGRFDRGGPGPGAPRPASPGAARAPAAPGPRPPAALRPRDEAPGRPLHEWQLVGQLWNTYLLLCDRERLVVVDQHAAHERVTFERLRAAAERDGVRQQRLLVPLQLDLGPAGAEAAAAEGERLAAVGIDIEPFGPGVVSVKAVPALLADAPVAELVRDALDELAESEAASGWEQRRLAVLSRMACHGSLRAGQALSEAEVRSLLEQVEAIDYGALCPHGRPVLVRFGRGEVEHWFHRG